MDNRTRKIRAMCVLLVFVLGLLFCNISGIGPMWDVSGWFGWLLVWSPAILLVAWLAYWIVLHRQVGDDDAKSTSQINAHLITFAVGYCWVTFVAIAVVARWDSSDPITLIETILYLWVPALGGICVVPIVARCWQHGHLYWLGSIAIMVALALAYVCLLMKIGASV